MSEITVQPHHEKRILDLYSSMRKKNAASVEKNEIEVDSMWGNQCLAYNVQIRLPSSIQTTLFRLQEEIHPQKTGCLLRSPVHSLHISVGRLIAVRADDSRQAKEFQWQSIRHASQVALNRIAQMTRSFQVRFCDVFATRGAIIAVATDDGSMATIREKLYQYIPLRSTPIDIIHSTLFRYRTRLENPQRLLAKLQRLNLNQTFVVDELQVRREKVYPSLVSDLVFVVKLSQTGASTQK